MAKGTITRKEIIEDDALVWGPIYAKNVQTAINKNDDLKKSALELMGIFEKLNKTTSGTELAEAQEAAAAAATNGTKAYEDQAKALAKVDEERTKQMRALLRVTNQRQNVDSKTNKQLIEQRKLLQQETKEIKNNMTFLGRLTGLRDKARKSIQELQAKQALGIKLHDQEQKELDQSVKKFDRYNKSLKDIREGTNQFFDNVGNYPQQAKAVVVSIRSIISALGLVAGLKEVFNFAKEAREFALEAKGVEFAFERIGIKGQEAFQKVKKASRGLLSDLDIKKSIVEFDNFNLDLDEMGGLLEFVSVRAAQTGKSFDGLRDSLVEGLSKESKLRIDNLGISATELNAELERTPNFVQAVANIAKKEVAEAGSILDDAANSQQQWNVAYENFQLAVGKGVIAQVADTFYSIGAAILNAISPTEEMGQKIGKITSFVLTAIGVFAIYKGAILAVGAAQKIATAFTVAYRIAVIAMNRGVLSAIKSVRILKVALIKTGIGAVIILVTALIFALKNMSVETTFAEKKQRLLNDAMEDAAKSVAKEKAELDSLLQTAKNENLSKEQRLRAIKELNKKSPEYLKNINLENINTQATTDAIEEYIKAMDKKALAQAFQNKKAELYQQLIEKESSSLEDNVAWYETLGNVLISGNNVYGAAARNVKTGIKNRNEDIVGIQEQIKAIDELIRKKEEENAAESGGDPNAGSQIQQVKDYRDAIKALQDEQETLTVNDKARGKEIVKQIKNYKKLIDAILGTSSASKKAGKDQESLNRQLAADEFNLAALKIKINQDTEKAIINNNKNSVGERLLGVKNFFDESVKLLDLERERAILNAEGRKDELNRIQLAYNSDYKKLEEDKQKSSEKIFVDEFNKAKQRIDEKKALEEAEFNKELVDLQTQLANKEITFQEYEDKLVQIKRDAVEETINAQISQVQAELLSATLSFEQRKSLEEQLAALKIALSQATTDALIEDEDKRLKSAEEALEAQKKIEEQKKQLISDASQNLAETLDLDAGNLERLITNISDGFENAWEAIGSVAAVVGDVFDSVFEANIEKIDQQIEASEAYYDRQIQLAGNDEVQRQLIEAEAEKKRKLLEDKKRKEKTKQAKIAKAAALTQAAINTALAVTAALATQPFLPLGPTMAVLAGVLGAVQIAAIAAKPIPKYSKGTSNHPGGFAEVAEDRPEVIQEPGKNPYLVNKRSVLSLPKKTKVYSSLEAYQNAKRASIMASFDAQSSRLNQLAFDSYNDDLINEMQLTRKAIEKNKPIPHKSNRPQDLNHEIFKFNNLNWGA